MKTKTKHINLDVMKIRIREGNDFDVVWAITRAGQPEDLSTATSMKLTLVVYGLVIEHNLFTVTDNVLSINIPKEVATVNGDYRLIFEYTLPDAGQPDGDLKCKTDVVPFRIVPFTAEADDIYTINVTSDIAFGFKGDKGDDGDDAYQIWLDLGNEGTYEDFIAYLRQPAVDAGASISELEGEIQVSEGLRVQAESERDLAEATRIQSESERLAAETIRQSNEGDRIENEDTRVQNEIERVSKESIRQSSETDRVEAEGVRQSNEINRVEAEDIRAQAEVERQITIQEAVIATNLANEKANLANTAAQSANEAAGLADTARTELTTAVNTKLGEADDKIEEMDTTLSTYDGRVTQVESDIDQLAGDVNELGIKDAVQGAKIKDIENVLSTANLNQSAQLSVSGRKSVSLPKNAANGGMQVKLDGLTAENLLVNGDFRNGTTGWQQNGVSGFTVTNGVASFTATRTYGNIIKPYSAPIGSIMYMLARVKGAGTVYVGTQKGATARKITGTGAFELISQRQTIDIQSPFFTLQDTAPSDWSEVSIDFAIIINLTETFGAGNEPDLATCDAMFSDYFEGVKSFVPTGRVRSVGKNLFNFQSDLNDTNGFIHKDTGLFVAHPSFQCTGYIKIKGGETYNWTYNCGGGIRGHSWYDKNKVFIASSYNTTLSLPQNAVYLRLNSSDQKISDNAVLSRGVAPTTYEPYKETNLYLTAPELRSNGAVKDEIRKGANGYELVKRISDVDGSVLATPEIIPISYGGVLNSAESGTVYHEPIIADAGIYSDKMDILLTDYPIASLEEIIKHENGVDTYLDVSTAVIAPDGLSFTHPDLLSGDLVLFTYAYNKESTNGNITATFYDSNVVKIDTVTGKAYKIEDVITNGVLTRTLTEV